MITVFDNKTFALTNAHFSYVFRVSPEGILEHMHYGGPLRDPLNVAKHHHRTQREVASNFPRKSSQALGLRIIVFLRCMDGIQTEIQFFHCIIRRIVSSKRNRV